jgi:hypothetical protein
MAGKRLISSVFLTDVVSCHPLPLDVVHAVSGKDQCAHHVLVIDFV